MTEKYKYEGELLYHLNQIMIVAHNIGLLEAKKQADEGNEIFYDYKIKSLNKKLDRIKHHITKMFVLYS